MMSNDTFLSRTEFAAGRYRHAAQFAQYAIAQNPDSAAAWQMLGKSLMQVSDYIGAIDALEHASLLQPLDNADRISLAIAYGAIGRTSLSRDLLMAVATSDRIETLDLLQIATGLEAIDEPRLAMEACRQAGQLSPDSAEVHYQMGHYAQQCGHPVNVGEALIRHAIGLDPDNVHYRIGLSSMLIRLGRKFEAVAVIDRIIPAKLDQVTCLCCLKRIANLFFDCDDLERAKQCAERIATLTAKSPESKVLEISESDS
ncbi:Tetratricopeptide repeat protein [Rubripirellula lacrimiformis]|uniref:Tetratricopeptide repeat protein n=1 Tax=Rubripirellula lacrimiformis TaxID=1930273 RepID=A0A517NCU1_9BACT|nr:tetratricopeptide repeat protein [Rubripirellula lacrimiformis]QDT04957.1 Tetratricopeptide repeat protein [Rubripirellula lacrimiformis]